MNPETLICVVDASAAVKHVLREEWSANVLALFNASTLAHRRIVGPPHIISESMNAIYQRLRTNRAEWRLSDDEVDTALATFLLLPIQPLDPPGLYLRAFDIARQYNLPSTYDALYVALAQMLDAELWTADRRLYDIVATSAPWVRWIGDYPLTPVSG